MKVRCHGNQERGRARSTVPSVVKDREVAPGYSNADITGDLDKNNFGAVMAAGLIRGD